MEVEQAVSTDQVKEIGLGEIYIRLDSSNDGLTSSEAKARLDTYGHNQIEERKKNPLMKLIGLGLF